MKAFKSIQDFRDNTSIAEQMEFGKELQTWLSVYTTEVATRVINNMDSIINNQMALNLIHELHVRTEEEREKQARSIRWALHDGAEVMSGEWLHNSCMSHAGSYRDVLYDMYIKQ